MTDTPSHPESPPCADRPVITLSEVTDPLTGKSTFTDLTAKGGRIHGMAPDHLVDGAPAKAAWSTLPTDRMAADPWAEIFRSLRDQENGQPGDYKVSMVAGGPLELTTPSGAKQQSVLPTGRMAADPWAEILERIRDWEIRRPADVDVTLVPGCPPELSAPSATKERSDLPGGCTMAALTVAPTYEEAVLLSRLDPQRIEGWQQVGNSLITGWRFQLWPPFEDRPYQFLAFRSPSDGNLYRIAVLWPNMDDQFGHKPHIVSVAVGGEEIKVICGPGGAPARDIAEVRTHACKWMAYTSARRTGRRPGFSE